MLKKFYLLLFLSIIVQSCRLKFYENRFGMNTRCPEGILILKRDGTFKFYEASCGTEKEAVELNGTYTKEVNSSLYPSYVVKYRPLSNLTLKAISIDSIRNSNEKSNFSSHVYLDVSHLKDYIYDESNLAFVIRLNGDSLLVRCIPDLNCIIELELNTDIESFKIFLGSELISEEVEVQYGQTSYIVNYFDSSSYNHTIFLESDLNLQNKRDLEFFYNEYIQYTLYLVNDTLYRNQVPEFIR